MLPNGGRLHQPLHLAELSRSPKYYQNASVSAERGEKPRIINHMVPTTYSSAGRFSPLRPLGILAAPIFEQAFDNSLKLCLSRRFTLGQETVDIKLRSPAL